MNRRLSFNVDKVFCISLKDRADRRLVLLKEIDKLNTDVEFLIVEKDTEDPQRGCFNSHVTCSKLAKSRGYSKILVLEDDVFFTNINSKNISRINRFLLKHNPEAFYLGAILGKAWLIWSYKIARIRGQGIHAVILNRVALNKVSNLEYTGKGIDSVYSKIFKSYTHIPMVAHQQPEEVFKSDLDFFRKHKGKNNDFWSKNKRKQYRSVVSNLFKTAFRIDF